MTWAPLLLAARSPCLRLLVLRELMGRPEQDIEVMELAGLRESDPLIADLLALQQPDGSWHSVGDLASGRGPLHTTSQALLRLGYLGLGPSHPGVRRGVEYVFAQQQEDGSWPIPTTQGENQENAHYTMVPLQTALPLRSLATCGYATDVRAERAYVWLISQQLPDGAWPTGIAADNYGYVAGYRRMPHSRWGCRSNTTGALACLALHPQHRSGSEARRALDLLLGRETREKHTMGFEIARIIGAEAARGFFTYYARFDHAFILDLCWRIGADLTDERIADLVQFVLELQGPYGLWNYAPYPQASRWVTFDLLRSLARLDDTGDWFSLEPRTPFQAYPGQRRRS